MLIALTVHEALPEVRRLRGDSRVALDVASIEAAERSVIDRLNVVFTDGQRWLAFDDHVLFESTDGGSSFQTRGRLPKVDSGRLPQFKDWIARTKAVRNARGNPGPSIVTVLGSGTILVFWDHLYRSDDGGSSFEALIQLHAGVDPPYFPSGVAVGPDDTVYFGEYTTKPRPNKVRIFRGTNDGKDWSVAHEFESGEIFHIHGIQYDHYREGYWVMTGDEDEESALLFTDDDFRTFQTLGAGSQDWRIISLIIEPDHLHWGSDDDVNGSAIFRWTFSTSTLERLQDIGSPAYYSTRLASGLRVITTAYEPDSEYTKKHDPPARAAVWASRDGDAWHRVLEVAAWAEHNAPGTPRGKLKIPASAPQGPPSELVLVPEHTVPDPHASLVVSFEGLTSR